MSETEEAVIEIGSFKAKSPHRDPSLYVAISAGVAAYNDSGNVWALIAVIAAWLVSHGYVRARGVEAAGVFAASLGPTVIEHRGPEQAEVQLGQVVEFPEDYDPGRDE